MSDDTDNLVLEHLRVLRSGQAELRENQHEIMRRLTTIEASYANLQNSMDRVRGDVDLIKRRLELSDKPLPEPSR